MKPMNEKVMKTRHILYARKSTESEDKQVLSIDSQIDELTALAKRSGLDDFEVRMESYSAKAPGRSVFNSVLNDIERDKAQGIIVWHPDRLSRNSVDTGRIIYLFDLGKLHEIVTPSQVFRNTPSDKFLLSLLCSQAKLENDNKGLNVKRGLKAKAEHGVYPTGALVGYQNEKYGEKGYKTIHTDPERFGLVRRLFDLMLTGRHTPPQILRIANEEWRFTMPNGKKLGRSTLYRILSHSFYYGIFEYPVGSGSWYKGTHKSMITPEEYDRIQALLGQRGKPRPKSHLFAFTGMMRCGECGCMITAEEKTKRQKNGNVHHYIYYHCTKRRDPNCSQRCLEEKSLRKQVLTILDDIEIPPEFHDWAIKWFEKTGAKDTEHSRRITANLQVALREHTDKIDTLIDMRAGQEITEEELKRRKSALTKEKIRLELLLTRSKQKTMSLIDNAEECFSFARDASTKFKSGDHETRRRVVANLGSNPVLMNKTFAITVRKPLIPLQRAAKEVKKIHEGFEPLKIPMETKELERLYASKSHLLRREDSNLQPSP